MPASDTDPASTPARVYYEGCVGSWRSPIQITITDGDALRRAGMSFADRVSLRVLSAWPRWLGRVHLETAVAFDGPARVVHTTVVRWLGIPLRRSTELFTLDADGRSFHVSGGMSGAGSVDETSAGAEYELRWLGVAIRQRTVREPDRVTVSQEGPGFRGAQELVRQR